MTLPIQDPTLAAEGLGVPPRRHGFLRSVLRERKTAVIGLAIIVFFIVLAVIAPYISPYSATAQTCAVYEPPSASHWWTRWPSPTPMPSRKSSGFATLITIVPRQVRR